MSGSGTAYLLPGIQVVDRCLQVPLDPAAPAGEQLTVFIRELCDPARVTEELPLLLYLQGGPGGSAPRPTDRSGWLGVALERYRVILLDQRGTGGSSPIDGAVLASRGDPTAQADYLSCFRADSIVADAEAVRQRLYGGRRWALLGQSYGGFISLSYLSYAPEALTACYVTGGIPALPPTAAQVYRRTFPRVRKRVAAFYRRFPGDAERAAAVADHLQDREVRLPDGDRLSVERFQSLGLDLGMGAGTARLHWLLENAFAAPGRLSDGFLQQVQERTCQRDRPLYWTLQEAIYGDGANGPTGWAAQSERDRHPDFAPTARPLLFTGEMAFPWMFEQIAALRPFAAAVQVLAERRTWSQLYDLDRLAANEVPLAAAVYHDDLFVDSGLQLAALDRVGASRAWVTNEWEHDGLSDARVLRGLMQRLDEAGGVLT